MPRRTPQDELDALLHQQAALKADLKTQRERLRQAALAKRADLVGRIRRAQTRLSHQDRRQRTRRLILLGTLIEHEIAQQPAERTRVMARLETFLTRDRDRALFGLEPRPDRGATTPRRSRAARMPLERLEAVLRAGPQCALSRSGRPGHPNGRSGVTEAHRALTWSTERRLFGAGWSVMAETLSAIGGQKHE